MGGSKVEKCVVILSGGIDSTTVAYWAKDQGYDVHAITFNYGQISVKEIDHAKEIGRGLGVSHKVLDLSALKEIYAGVTSLVDTNIPITEEFSHPIIVPFRNGVFLAVAVAYASSIGANKIFYGAHRSDEPYYPDCREGFYNAFEQAAKLGTEQQIIINAPFSKIEKSDILSKACELNVPLHLTWSCYNNLPKHCGKCESCANRKKAFMEAKIIDPTEYVE